MVGTTAAYERNGSSGTKADFPCLVPRYPFTWISSSLPGHDRDGQYVLPGCPLRPHRSFCNLSLSRDVQNCSCTKGNQYIATIGKIA